MVWCDTHRQERTGNHGERLGADVVDILTIEIAAKNNGNCLGLAFVARQDTLNADTGTLTRFETVNIPAGIALVGLRSHILDNKPIRVCELDLEIVEVTAGIVANIQNVLDGRTRNCARRGYECEGDRQVGNRRRG